jgi:hypothetical protein
MPFVTDSDEVLKEIGFVDTIAGFTTPNELLPGRSREITADLGASGAFIGLMIFLGSSVGSWAIGKACDGLFESKLRPVLARLTEKIRSVRAQKRSLGVPFQFRCATWYEHDQLLVQVTVEISDPAVGRYLVLAQQMAASWVQEHGAAVQLLAYRVEGGQLEGPEEISRSEPPR